MCYQVKSPNAHRVLEGQKLNELLGGISGVCTALWNPNLGFKLRLGILFYSDQYTPGKRYTSIKGARQRMATTIKQYRPPLGIAHLMTKLSSLSWQAQTFIHLLFFTNSQKISSIFYLP